MNNVSADMDYQETIRAAAQAFIERHQSEHLGDLGQLLRRTVDHLVESFDVKESLANHLVHLAYSNVLAVIGRQRIDLQAAATTQALIKTIAQQLGRCLTVLVDDCTQEQIDAIKHWKMKTDRNGQFADVVIHVAKRADIS
ncbi:hypothetical protein TOC8171_04440 [Pseudomonas syringae]